METNDIDLDLDIFSNTKHYEKCKKEQAERNKKYYLKNKEDLQKKQTIYKNKMRKTDVKFNVSSKMANRLRNILKKDGIKKTCKTFGILGYPKQHLIKRLRKSLTELNRISEAKYTWRHFLNAELHIDHILPISKFNYKSTDDEAFKLCWSLENLQLLPAKENLEKRDKCENFEEKYQELKLKVSGF